ncbi:MAG: hypothetical protein AB1894_01980 [Chloroflexota bacterium]
MPECAGWRLAILDVPFDLRTNLTRGAQVLRQDARTWRLAIPAGPAGRYRLAQMDDYGHLRRSAFRWRPPFSLELQGRASTAELPGTWGFGVWNDPFGMGLLTGGEALRLPTLPNAAWFFFASPQNYLSLRDDLPAHGNLAAVFRAPRWPPIWLTPALLGLPLLALPPGVRLLRRLGRTWVGEAACVLALDPSLWHSYRLDWQLEQVCFQVDGQTVLSTQVAPNGPLGLVLWVDNQYAAMPPSGRVRYGMLQNPEAAWIELRDLKIETIC